MVEIIHDALDRSLGRYAIGRGSIARQRLHCPYAVDCLLHRNSRDVPILLAMAVFYLGLGIGLKSNPTLGMLPWLISGTIVAINLA